ncbi:MAG: DNA mismatch repair endonuclease MutL [Saprospiraceae bacterium]|nr:DNA mismatch repair endonuclease MutL [Saprospiraceae bacterium]
MSDIIHLLSDDIANKIAAGEVVVRPAAVVKELVENSVDAGASDIQLIIRDGGKALIQLVDDGCGMSETDARMSFERHATSKINTIDDLFSVRTMGFRGEALASIAAVAKVDLKTRRVNDELATNIVIEGSNLTKQELCQAPVGTNIAVKSLFYNVPARRKFLKSDSVETRHILEEFTRIALAHPGIRMSFFNNDKEVFRLPAQNLRQRIVSLFSRKHDERLVPVGEYTDIVNVEGFIGKPEFAKKSKGEQFFFVNDRFIKSGYLHHAVMSAYQDFLEPKQQPLYVLKLQLDPTRLDINVHPSKHEVKFEDEKHIYTIVAAAVRHALSKFSVTPTLDFEADPSFNRHEFFSGPKDVLVDNPVREGSGNTFLKRHQDLMDDRPKDDSWKQFYELDKSEPHPANELDVLAESSELELVQVNGKFILMPTESGFLLIDQRRAHQRILLERLETAVGGFPSQKLLFPQTIPLSIGEVQRFEQHSEVINQLGFQLEVFGKDSLVVHASPADLSIENLAQLVEDVLADLQVNGVSNPRASVARQLALHGAIKHGQKLNKPEMQKLVNELFACQQPNYGIRKDKTFLTYSNDQLDKAFFL